ncbi:DNA polymerase III subunit chi [Salipiger aestuarii]|uniref:DNA polymerase III subunit chi n=1 Tax=Salipiger aestuarii TaxID=568098 RepID=UPI00025B785F|nr:DNA polymerase III subunit chi [Salipiger aestuarii]EIE52974.1 DNA polymerase III subunit chi [Citreicella sp. 357]KAA8610258.1 DNA polymerase III subunit chi [Salipiger aestuarii]
MGAAYFYHLTHRPLEAALPALLEKSLAAGWRVTVRGVDPQRMEWLDQKLWLGADDGFLPHGLAGGAHDALQPVLLTVAEGLTNGTSCLMSVDGAPVSADETNRLERVCILFDGQDPQAVDHARGQWKALAGAGCAAQYWSEASGRWEKKAET